MKPVDPVPGTVPCDLAAERAVLGAAMLDASTLPLVRTLAATDFAHEGNRLVHGAITRLLNRGEVVELFTIRHELRQRGEFEDAGGDVHLATCCEEGVVATSTPAYVRILRECAAKRRLAELAHSVRAAALNGRPAGEIVQQLEQELTTLRSPGAQSEGAVSVRLSTVTPQAIEWVWPGRLARGKSTLLSGDPGLGKSTVVLDLVARISTGRSWPDGRGIAPRGSTVLLSAEDGVADTILPRVLAMGGDPARVHVVEAVRRGGREHAFDLGADVDVLERLANEIGEVVLIGVDPVSAYLGQTDSHRDASMRGVLAPLAAMAERLRTAVVLIGHLNKATKETARKAIYRPQGSIGLLASARMAFVVGLHPGDPDRRVLVHAKNNLGPIPPTLGFRVVATSEGVARIEWDSDPVPDLTADDVLREPGAGATRPVVAFLERLMPPGHLLPATEGARQAEAQGFSESAMRRARRQLGIEAQKVGMGGGWLWVRPKASPEDVVVSGDRRDGVFCAFKDVSSPEDVSEGEENDAFMTSSKETTSYNTLSLEDVTSRESSRARERTIEVPARSFLRQSMPTEGAEG